MRFEPREKLVAAVLLTAVVLALAGGPAQAHAEFSGGEPGAGARLSESPDRVRLTFSEPVAAEFDPVQVTGSDGERVDREDAGLAPGDANTVEIGLDNLAAGTYTVEYRVTSVDGHVISGGYEFEVAAAPQEESTQAVEEPTAVAPTTPETTEEPIEEPTGETLPETEPASENSGPLGTYAIIGLVILGLAALAVAAGRAARRRS